MARPRRDVNVKDLTKRISKNLMIVGEDFLSLGRAIQSGMSAGRRSNGRGPGRPATAGRARGGRPRRSLNARDHARLRMQGEYLGLVRHLAVRTRNKVKSLRARKGYPAAIKMARRLVRARG